VSTGEFRFLSVYAMYGRRRGGRAKGRPRNGVSSAAVRPCEAPLPRAARLHAPFVFVPPTTRNAAARPAHRCTPPSHREMRPDRARAPAALAAALGLLLLAAPAAAGGGDAATAVFTQLRRGVDPPGCGEDGAPPCYSAPEPCGAGLAIIPDPDAGGAQAYICATCGVRGGPTCRTGARAAPARAPAARRARAPARARLPPPPSRCRTARGAPPPPPRARAARAPRTPSPFHPSPASPAPARPTTRRRVRRRPPCPGGPRRALPPLRAARPRRAPRQRARRLQGGAPRQEACRRRRRPRADPRRVLQPPRRDAVREPRAGLRRRRRRPRLPELRPPRPALLRRRHAVPPHGQEGRRQGARVPRRGQRQLVPPGQHQVGGARAAPAPAHAPPRPLALPRAPRGPRLAARARRPSPKRRY
jgi:hypothetical protein